MSSGAKKLFAHHLTRLDSPINGFVWLQGIVVDVSEDMDTVVIDDGTGLVSFINVCKALSFYPKDLQVLMTGDYAMFLASQTEEQFFAQAHGSIPLLLAQKVQLLHQNKKATTPTMKIGSNIETLWLLEVLDSSLI